MKTTALVNALCADDLKGINGGMPMPAINMVFVDHIHCIQPEPGTCSCSPAKSFAKHEYI